MHISYLPTFYWSFQLRAFLQSIIKHEQHNSRVYTDYRTGPSQELHNTAHPNTAGYIEHIYIADIHNK